MFQFSPEQALAAEEFAKIVNDQLAAPSPEAAALTAIIEAGTAEASK